MSTTKTGYAEAMAEARKHTAREAKAQAVASWIVGFVPSAYGPRDVAELIRSWAQSNTEALDSMTATASFPKVNRPSLTTWLRVAAILYGQDDR
jgi:hypothetical protein